MRFCCAILASFLLLLSCTKENQVEPFVKGQEVTFGINVGENPETKVTSSVSDGKITFKWEQNDKILVSVTSGGVKKTAVFDLVSGAGEKAAYFRGIMPSDGNSFEVQYPVDHNISSQTYSSDEAIPHDAMKWTGTGSITDGKATVTSFNAQCAVLKLKLWGAKTTTINSIKLSKYNSTSGAYDTPFATLSCSAGLTLSSDQNNPTVLRIVVPIGEYKIKADVCKGSESLRSFCSKNTIDFQQNNSYSMATKEVYLSYPGTDIRAVTIGGTIWAPVNCGYDTTNKMGLLYQWGRKFGQGTAGYIKPYGMRIVGDKQIVQTPMRMSQDYELRDSIGLYNIDNKYNWYLVDDDNPFVTDRWNKDLQNNSDPCPDGWRVPTRSELKSLGNFSKASEGDGCCIEGKLHLPYVGYRDAGGSLITEQVSAIWSADDADSSYQIAYSLWFKGETLLFDQVTLCAYGASVRCIHE